MMPMTRQEIEILLDSPDQRNYVVSAYADMTVQGGFARHVDQHLRNQLRAAGEALAQAKARKDLEANVEVVRQVVQRHNADGAKGLAVFSSVARKLRHVVPLDFPVENRLIIDDEPFILPLLERWFGEPVYLIALLDSDEVHLFESHVGVVEPVRDLERPDVDQPIQRDKPRFTYKKRFAQTRHERLHAPEDDKFLQDVAEFLQQHWRTGRFSGLILLGQAQITSALQRILHKDLQSMVVDEAPLTMTTKSDEVAEEVKRVMARWHADRDSRMLAELQERWKENHRVANGPTEVLDALQQGRATSILFGNARDLTGARCLNCGYRFGAPVGTCVYCQGRCKSVNAVQEVLRMALRHRVPVHLFRRAPQVAPVDRAGGVVAYVRADANWAPNPQTTEATEKP